MSKRLTYLLNAMLVVLVAGALCAGFFLIVVLKLLGEI
jgi:hypothetical protein